ncbi:hypothetical protein ACF08M_15905 [Streptomyces sp. NPDC015032]|uniref:hypothetical protein n=1 Tax=Streptomyces sp. NPDC015032 TaxID=3364937 RepID=UPI0036F7CE45
MVTLLGKAGTARAAAERETHARVAHLLTGGRAQGLDGLLVGDPKWKTSRLHRLVTGPVQASPNSMGGEVETLKFLRGLDADTPYWELCTLLALREACARGTFMYRAHAGTAAPAAYLFKPAQWEEHREEEVGRRPLGNPG